MPFQASFEIQGAKEWGYYELGASYIYDNFGRAPTSGTLGYSTNGQPWNILSGNWYIVSSGLAAVTETASNSTPWPIVVFDLGDTKQLTYFNGNGSDNGLAFSVIDANNWYAIGAYTYAHGYSCNCLTCVTCNICEHNCIVGQNCAQCGTNQYGDCNSCTYGCVDSAVCPPCSETQYTCDCSLCYDYYYYVTVIQNVNGNINTISTTNITSPSSSIALEFNNGTVDYYSYSSTISGIITEPYGLGTVLTSGSLIISGTFGTQVGMVQISGGHTPYDPGYTTFNDFFGTGLYGV